MIPRDVANDEMIDYTHTLEFLCHYLLAPGCSVVLSPSQFEVLKAYLGHIDQLGDDVNYQLEMCRDHRPGYSVSWDNDGSRYQDDAVDALMEDMIQNLGFEGGSIKRPGHMIGLAEIDQRVAEILDQVRAKHTSAT
ncbi:hypothetical protein CN140_01510 [Sinorhizobium meliloti]|uniref:hypothetical protein n=1 Tax=Rhizobium meliloti TaxID=382 RepID=UPI000FDBF5C7|nr:hypothetical protein [Sinorhizobium meliloti]RVL87635.1 hypothetical protein CN140_01510 [Sinorhizobium meliloti]